MAETAYHQALILAGDRAVLIPIKAGTKAALVGGWQKLTLEEAKKEKHVARLEEAATVAVLLGPPSANLVVVDLDTDEAADAFLASNQRLAGSLQTRGKRGMAVWLRMAGPYPMECRKLRNVSGEPVGEWRAGGCYQVISGMHPEGVPYRVITQGAAAQVAFEEIQWPPDWENVPFCKTSGWEARKEGMNGEGNPMQKTSSAWDSSSSEEGAGAQRKKGGSRLSWLQDLHERFIAQHWTPKAGERNRFIAEGIPFLHHAMCDDAVQALGMRYYDENASLWNAPRATHESEMRAHLRNVARRFAEEELSSREQAAYASLKTERQRAAFRICRHLAQHTSIRPDCEGQQFIMAYGDMGTRLLIHCGDAPEIMKQLMNRGVVEIVRKGVKRQQGVRGRMRATVWRWCL